MDCRWNWNGLWWIVGNDRLDWCFVNGVCYGLVRGCKGFVIVCCCFGGDVGLDCEYSNGSLVGWVSGWSYGVSL